MKCGKCEFARIDLKDDEDVYYCPFDNMFAFHSGEECHHPHERTEKLSNYKNRVIGVDLNHAESEVEDGNVS